MPTRQIIINHFFFWTGSVFLLDQFSKKLVSFYWPEILYCNTQMALGLPKNALFFWLGYILFFGFLLWLIFKHKSLALFLVLGGTLSNLFDRLFWGCVVDWIALPGFPIFNLADIMISLGLIWFLFQSRKNLF